MARKIDAGASSPHHRKWKADADGNYTPDTGNPTPPTEAEPKEEVRPFALGDLVASVGRVTEIHNPQAGLQSIRVQMPSGSAWHQMQHLVHADELESRFGQKIQELEATIAEQTRLLTTAYAENAALADKVSHQEQQFEAACKRITEVRLRAGEIDEDGNELLTEDELAAKAVKAPQQNKAILKAPETK